MTTPLYISNIVLTNVKCFGRDEEVSIDHSGEGVPFTVVVGDNAAGKTALLRSIALGLCDQSSAAGLMKESDEGYIRRDEQTATIKVELIDRETSDTFTITTTITKQSSDSISFETLTQRTVPSNAFPWHRVFACAYGMGRATGGTGDISGWSVINAVYNLFSYGEGLQNPELTILRIPDEQQRDFWLAQVGRLLDIPENAIHRREGGITISDPRWGDDMPLRDLADGYRATFLWVADFVGWALAFDNNITKPEDICGVVLVDELEQHLHARWQRRIVGQLRTLFPNVQFVVTTHSPFVAASIGDLSVRPANDRLVLSEIDPDTKAARLESLDTMQAYRFEQVVASRAFKYVVEANPDLEAAIQRASVLSDRGDQRTEEEQREYDELKATLKGAPFLRATSSAERDIEQERLADLKRRERDADPKDAGHD